MKRIICTLTTVIAVSSAVAQPLMPALAEVHPNMEHTLQAFEAHKSNARLIKKVNYEYLHLFCRAFENMENALDSLETLIAAKNDSTSVAQAFAFCDTAGINMGLWLQQFETTSFVWVSHVKAALATACEMPAKGMVSWEETHKLEFELDNWAMLEFQYEPVKEKAAVLLKKLIDLREQAIAKG